MKLEDRPDWLEEPFKDLEHGGDFVVGRLPDGREFTEYTHCGQFSGKVEYFAKTIDDLKAMWLDSMSGIIPSKGKILWRIRPEVSLFDFEGGRKGYSIYARFLIEEDSDDKATRRR